jgi:hypothetical protein
MEPIKFSLCEHCLECPEVEITDQGVTIGEDENIVRLSHAQWNELVRLVKDDKLREVWKLKPPQLAEPGAAPRIRFQRKPVGK